MRKPLLLALTGLTLTGGIAFADEHHRDDRRDEHREQNRDRDRDHDRDRDRRDEQPRYEHRYNEYDRGEGRVHYRNYRERPALRYEARPYDRDGYEWVAGDWIWNGFEWIWRPGHYMRTGWRINIHL